jgi:hypothetical protein
MLTKSSLSRRSLLVGAVATVPAMKAAELYKEGIKFPLCVARGPLAEDGFSGFDWVFGLEKHNTAALDEIKAECEKQGLTVSSLEVQKHPEEFGVALLKLGLRESTEFAHRTNQYGDPRYVFGLGAVDVHSLERVLAKLEIMNALVQEVTIQRSQQDFAMAEIKFSPFSIQTIKCKRCGRYTQGGHDVEQDFDEHLEGAKGVHPTFGPYTLTRASYAASLRQDCDQHMENTKTQRVVLVTV